MQKQKKKESIIERKNNLGIESVYIENYLTWNERRMKEKVALLAKKIKSEGQKAKVGYNRVIGEKDIGYGYGVRQTRSFFIGKKKKKDILLKPCRNKKKERRRMGRPKRI